jgi:capsule polysaccharide export protein KpsC/LpsZ
VAEHFFTGNDFYLEYRDKPIANNCGVQRQLGVDFSLKEKVNEPTISAYMHSRIKGMRNRNVPKRNISFSRSWSGRDPVILIIGQVVNDFSIIETPSDEVSSIAIYKKAIIDLLSNTNANLIFKAHPWERRRAPLFSPITKLKIEDFIRLLPEKDQLRITVIEDQSIQNIFQVCDGVMGISSQGLLESCYYGFKPVLLGKAFFSNKDFTQDVNKILIKYKFDKALWKLSLYEYSQFQSFMKEMFTEVLIPNEEVASALTIGKLSKHNAQSETKFMLDVIGTSRVDWMVFFRDLLERPSIWIRLLRIWIKSKLRSQSST